MDLFPFPVLSFSAFWSSCSTSCQSNSTKTVVPIEKQLWLGELVHYDLPWFLSLLANWKYVLNFWSERGSPTMASIRSPQKKGSAPVWGVPWHGLPEADVTEPGTCRHVVLLSLIVWSSFQDDYKNVVCFCLDKRLALTAPPFRIANQNNSAKNMNERFGSNQNLTSEHYLKQTHAPICLGFHGIQHPAARCSFFVLFFSLVGQLAQGPWGQSIGFGTPVDILRFPTEAGACEHPRILLKHLKILVKWKSGKKQVIRSFNFALHPGTSICTRCVAHYRPSLDLL